MICGRRKILEYFRAGKTSSSAIPTSDIKCPREWKIKELDDKRNTRQRKGGGGRDSINDYNDNYQQQNVRKQLFTHICLYVDNKLEQVYFTIHFRTHLLDILVEKRIFPVVGLIRFYKLLDFV